MLFGRPSRNVSLIRLGTTYRSGDDNIYTAREYLPGARPIRGACGGPRTVMAKRLVYF